MKGKRAERTASVGVLAAVLLIGCGEGRDTQTFADIGAGLTGVGNCSLAWGDYDSDGDLDLALAGHDGVSPVSEVYRNDGGAFTDIGAGLVGVDDCSLAWGDYDSDGDLDLALAGSGVSKICRNDGGTFADIGAGLTGVDNCCLAWGDYDNDGDLDLALAGWDKGFRSMSKVYRNDGGAFTDIAAALTGVNSCSLAWGDYDNDGDLDLALAGTGDGSIPVSKVYRNDGGTFLDVGAALTGVGWRSSVAWGDYDNDGDLDLALAGLAIGGRVSKVYRNDGGMFTDIGAGLTGVWYCSLAWGDYDSDGDLDLALAGDTGSGYIGEVYRNDGGGAFTDIGAGLAGVYECSLAWGDYDSDGDLDLALAGMDSTGAGVSKVYRSKGGVFNWPPSAPGSPSISISANEATLSWVAATDPETPQAGLSYNLRASTSPGACDLASGMADATTGRRLVPALGNAQENLSWTVSVPAGTSYLSVQAVDSAFAGSAWAAEQSVFVPLAVSWPNGGERLEVGRSQAIAWTASGIASVDIDLSRDGGATWEPIAASVDAALGSFSWTVTAPSSDRCLVRVSDTSAPATGDTSDCVFRILPFTDIHAGLVGTYECSLAWGDYDNDADLDLALVGRFASRLYGNDDGVLADTGTMLAWVNRCSLAWGDYDNDGDLDLALAGDRGVGSTSEVYHNDGGVFTDIGASLTGVEDCSLAWGDYDNDGDLDLALAGWAGGRVSKVYRNDGGVFTDILAGLVGVYYCSLAWGDYDNDGDLDLALAGRGESAGISRVYRNDGGVFTDIGAGLTGVWECSLAWGDYDNDGDLDLALAGRDMGVRVSKVYRNDGGALTDIGAALPGVFRCSLAWGDYDSDGDLDLAMAGCTTGVSYVSRIYRNDGGIFTDILAGLVGVHYCSLAWGDYDNDSDLDLALAGLPFDSQDVSKVYRNDGGVFNSPPSPPAGLSASYVAAATDYDVTFTWDAATDAETPQDGLSYNLRVGTTAGGDDVFSGMAQADGWRKLPARGVVQPGGSANEWTLTLPADTYYWSVQAIDTAFAGSPWAPEETVTVP